MNKPLQPLRTIHTAGTGTGKRDGGLRNVEPLIEMALKLRTEGISKKDGRGRDSIHYSYVALRIIEQAARAAKKRGDFQKEVELLEQHIIAREKLQGLAHYYYTPLGEALGRLAEGLENRPGADREQLQRIYRRQAEVWELAAKGADPVTGVFYLEKQAAALGKAGDEDAKTSVLWKLAKQYRRSAEVDEGRFKEDAPLLPQVFPGLGERPGDFELRFSVFLEVLTEGSGPSRPREQNFAERIKQDLSRIVETRTGEAEALEQINDPMAREQAQGAREKARIAKWQLESLEAWMKTQPWYVEKH